MEEYIVFDFSKRYLMLVNEVGDRRLYPRAFANDEPEFTCDKLLINSLNQLGWSQIILKGKIFYKNEYGNILDDKAPYL